MRVLKTHTIYLGTSASFTTENDCVLIFEGIDNNVADHNNDFMELYLLDSNNPPDNRIRLQRIWPGIVANNIFMPVYAAAATRFEIALSFVYGHTPENLYVYEVA